MSEMTAQERARRFAFDEEYRAEIDRRWLRNATAKAIEKARKQAYEEGYRQGYAEGLKRGILIGQIKLLREHLHLEAINTDTLNSMSYHELDRSRDSLFEQYQASRSGTTNDASST